MKRRAQTAGADLLPMAAALITATLIISGLVVMGRPGLHKAGLSGPGFTSVFQGAIRPTTFVGIPTAYALFGDTGLALFAAALLAVIPIAFWDERLSTSAVQRVLIDEADMTRKRRAEVVDKMAAAYILQGALDFIKTANAG